MAPFDTRATWAAVLVVDPPPGGRVTPLARWRDEILRTA